MPSDHRKKNGRWDPTKALHQREGSGILSNGLAIRRLPDTDLVFKTSRWQRYQWSDFRGGAVEAVKTEKAGEKNLPRWPAYMRELFVRLHSEDPQRLEDPDPSSSWAEEAHNLATELPEFSRLRDRCRGDKLWSGMAATTLAGEVLQAFPTPDEPLEDTRPLEQRARGFEGLQRAGVPVDQELEAAKQQLEQARQRARNFAGQIDPGAIRQAMRRACETAQEQIESSQHAAAAYGWGSEEGGDGRGGDMEQKRKILDKVQRSSKLMALAKLAGRMKRIAAQKQRSKTNHARDEISSITIGDDLARLLPSEVGKLARPETKLVFYRGLIERNLLCYELKGSEPQGKGPIIVAVDNSGSMAGDRELWSKAVALALLDIAKRQNRSYVLIHFDTSVKLTLKWERGPNPPEWSKVIEAMEYFSGGGTKFDPPLRKALDFLESDAFKKADVILVTDGAADKKFAGEYRRRAQAKEATTYGVLIGGGWGGDDALSAYCDKVLDVQDLDGESTATDAIFSI